jgi:TetR/AcrR family transcriptional regulator, tetracycline repressor protein
MAKAEKGHTLTRQKVIEAALQVMDREGLDGFNMRKLGAELGVEAMSLYNHIKNKDDLLDAVNETLILQAQYPQQPDVTPYQALWDFAHAYRDVLRAHPRVITLVATRQLRTEPSLAILERLLTTMHRAHISRLRALYAVNSLASFIIGHAFIDVAGLAVPGAEQEGDPMDIWRRLPVNHYPILQAAIHEFQQWDADDEFDYGLQTLLQGFLPPDG